ncbi:MAG: virion morphogenesis protein, partial [Deltaproteobacteria bacterium]
MEHIQIENLEETQELLLKIDKKIRATKPLMANISEHLYNVVLNSFEEEKSPDGIAWTPIKPRKADKHPEKILFDSGDMQKRQYKKYDNNSAIVGFNAVSNNFQYPLTHQFGTNKAGKSKNITIVARP